MMVHESVKSFSLFVVISLNKSMVIKINVSRGLVNAGDLLVVPSGAWDRKQGGYRWRGVLSSQSSN